MLKDHEIRVIKTGKDALLELIYETIIEKGHEYFDLSSEDEVSYDIQVDLQEGSLICVAHSICDPNTEIDIGRINEVIGVTTQSFFAPNKYVPLKLSLKTGNSKYEVDEEGSLFQTIDKRN